MMNLVMVYLGIGAIISPFLALGSKESSVKAKGVLNLSWLWACPELWLFSWLAFLIVMIALWPVYLIQQFRADHSDIDKSA